MIVGVAIQQPSDQLDWDIDYTNWLSEGDALADVDIPNPPAGLTVQGVVSNETRIKVWISGGTAGETYKLEINATTTGNRIKQDEIEVIIEEF